MIKKRKEIQYSKEIFDLKNLKLALTVAVIITFVNIISDFIEQILMSYNLPENIVIYMGDLVSIILLLFIIVYVVKQIIIKETDDEINHTNNL